MLTQKPKPRRARYAPSAGALWGSSLENGFLRSCVTPWIPAFAGKTAYLNGIGARGHFNRRFVGGRGVPLAVPAMETGGLFPDQRFARLMALTR